MEPMAGVFEEALPPSVRARIRAMRTATAEWPNEADALSDWQLRERIVERNLPPTEEMRRTVTDAEATLAEGKSTRTHLKRIEQMLPMARWQLNLCEARDVIQATRPDGCWCLGTGGRGRRYTPGLQDEEPYYTWDQYCECEDGRHLQLEHTAYMGRYCAKLRAGRFHRLLGCAELGRYANASLSTAVAGAQRRIGELPKSYAQAVDDLREWCTCERVAWLYLWGSYGSGKTHLLAAVLRELLENQISLDAQLITAPDLLGRIQATYSGKEGDPTTAEVVAAYRGCSLLLLDDLGTEYGTEWARSTLYALLNARYWAQAQTAITANLSPQELMGRFSQGLADRIFEHCLVIHLDDHNLRDSAI